MISEAGNHILIAMDMSEMDEVLIRYLPSITELLNAKKITFLHNIRLRELPTELKEPSTLSEIQARVKDRIKRQVEQGQLALVPHEVGVTTEEFSESAFQGLAKREGVDLVVLGNKQQLEGSGELPQKLARLLPCDFLLVPEMAQPHPTRFLTAIDFSKYSSKVHAIGRFFSEKSIGGELHCVHVAKAPVHFFLGFNQFEINKLLRAETETRKAKWLKQQDIAGDIEVIQADGAHIASAILAHAQMRQADMVLMGVKGSSSLTNLFIGGVTNEIFHYESNIPILILKADEVRKDERPKNLT
ncbi:universal stress protein [Olivibacter sp. XZL3]|uniref:universal stress protein n=1 Tax=Olivibacter sp. XZL3 TaxID=1735116 RepID=UPI001066F9A0|nr:universal stress protein [Olivibacter sp. XZL3]